MGRLNREKIIKIIFWKNILLYIQQIMFLEENFILKGRRIVENFYSVQLFWDCRNVLIGLN